MSRTSGESYADSGHAAIQRLRRLLLLFDPFFFRGATKLSVRLDTRNVALVPHANSKASDSIPSPNNALLSCI